uniref:Uncharacterized protein n=1 Tax=Solanum tuberosum TaxID=4113 RepID=M1CI36_SOLTU
MTIHLPNANKNLFFQAVFHIRNKRNVTNLQITKHMITASCPTLGLSNVGSSCYIVHTPDVQSLSMLIGVRPGYLTVVLGYPRFIS